MNNYPRLDINELLDILDGINIKLDYMYWNYPANLVFNKNKKSIKISENDPILKHYLLNERSPNSAGFEYIFEDMKDMKHDFERYVIYTIHNRAIKYYYNAVCKKCSIIIKTYNYITYNIPRCDYKWDCNEIHYKYDCEQLLMDSVLA